MMNFVVLTFVIKKFVESRNRELHIISIFLDIVKVVLKLFVLTMAQ